MAQMAGVAVLVTVMALGSTAAPAPVGANPADVHLTVQTLSPQYSLGGCRYKVIWGSLLGLPAMEIRVYDMGVCGFASGTVEYRVGSTVTTVSSYAVTSTGTDACGAYDRVQVVAPTGGVALRALAWFGTGYRWYADDGLDTQAIHSTC